VWGRLFLSFHYAGLGEFEKNHGFMRVPSGQRSVPLEMIASVSKNEGDP
jgi:hypothetical protein